MPGSGRIRATPCGSSGHSTNSVSSVSTSGVDDFNRADVVVQLGDPPHRIDVRTSIDGVDLERAWARKVLIHVDGQSIPFISREDLITNKRAAGRPHDVADVARLTESEA